MSNAQSITRWLEGLRDDSSLAAQKLWDHYFQQMVRLARRRLPAERRQMADEEDVALSAFKSFCVGVRQGRFQHLVNRDGLWPLLVAITVHKAQDCARAEGRQKRGGEARRQPLWEEILSRAPEPEVASQLADQVERLLDHLDQTGDTELRPVVLWSLEGYTAAEIAGRLDCAVRTVQRKLKIVRRLWLEGCDA